MRQWGKFVIFIFIFIALLLGVNDWPADQSSPLTTPESEQNLADVQLEDQIVAERLLKLGQVKEALSLIRNYDNEINKQTDLGERWLSLLIEGSLLEGNVKQLAILYQYFPLAFEINEQAALLVAENYLHEGRYQDYELLRIEWKGREETPETWFTLDVDKLLSQGKQEDAIRLMRLTSLEGDAETARLTRLALLTAKSNPKEAWQYLTEAYKKAPYNTDIRSYRGRLLESVGKEDLALAEYVAAAQTDQQNIDLQDQLAQFNIRLGRYEDALNIWGRHLKHPTNEQVWIKSLFWNRVALSTPIDWNQSFPPKGPLLPLISYLEKLPPGTFWDAQSFENVQSGEEFLKTEQSTFWLRLIQALKNQQEGEAANLLKYNPFTESSWAPGLEIALKRILKFRKDKTLELGITEASTRDATGKPFFKTLQQNAQNGIDTLPKETYNLLLSPDVFAVAFLEQGWFEAALELKTTTQYSQNLPSWVPLHMTQAIYKSEGAKHALHFAQQQPATPELTVLLGELFIADHQVEKALLTLAPLVKQSDAQGTRAAWLISQVLIEKGDLDVAKEVILNHPTLGKEVLGKETLARICLTEGNTDEAESIYITIEQDSCEAKSYLARLAYAEEDWKRARKLTEELLKQYPANSMLLTNLKKIQENEKNAKVYS